MLIPIGTDAPIYHWPITTGILIVVNICVFVLQSSVGEGDPFAMESGHAKASFAVSGPTQEIDKLDLELDRRDRQEEAKDQEPEFDFNDREFDLDDLGDLEDPQPGLDRELMRRIKSFGWRPFALWIGDGIHPIQWLTSFFMHLDIMHLIGNMIFLGLFGLVVESRMGNWQFGVYYLAIGIADSMVTQIFTLGVSDGGVALGASGAIYGIMATAMLWWPRFNVICLLLLWFYAFFPRIPIMIFGIFYVLMDVTSIVFGERLVDTGFLHVVGATVGAIGATTLWWRGTVNTEHQDFFSIVMEIAGQDPKKRKPRKLSTKERAAKKEKQQEKEVSKRFRLEQIWRSVDAHLAADNLDAAIMMERQSRQIDPKASWDEPRILRLIGKLQTKQEWDKVVHYSEMYLKKFESRATTIQINLAKVLLLHKHMPRKAIKVVRAMENSKLDDSQTKTLQQIVLKAQQLIDAGTLEFGD